MTQSQPKARDELSKGGREQRLGLRKLEAVLVAARERVSCPHDREPRTQPAERGVQICLKAGDGR
eukprot:CAMPEP_0174742272 /NCGR_PEP_ID=MMETSP1094-20130205/78427_1 /TAXON_ID=156173 /ORGANISM="Chrysochromulina brevifilum, Strain UTEX LB 985" /LENGTH=64 /DNA_ID=CAMNT_0015946301 /DNA_START=207 /DNA_END=401 /DNA_ORIENTATION=-